jgi:hypothetical protein
MNEIEIVRIAVLNVTSCFDSDSAKSTAFS